MPFLINFAREKGVSAYVGDGLNRWPAVHRLDAAVVYRLALERSAAGTRYHAVAEEGIPLREIASVIGRRLKLPVVSKTLQEAKDHFGWFAQFAAGGVPASSQWTRERLGWQPERRGLIADLERGSSFGGCTRASSGSSPLIDRRREKLVRVSQIGAARRRWPHIDAQKEITMQNKPVALVTGANKGIGLQIAKDLAARGFTVLVGSRNLEHGEAAAKSVGADARALQLDVTNHASIAGAAGRIRNEFGRLDLLVNNAAISHVAGRVARGDREVGPPERGVSRRSACGVRDERVRVIAVTQAMLPLLREAPAGRIVKYLAPRAR